MSTITIYLRFGLNWMHVVNIQIRNSMGSVGWRIGLGQQKWTHVQVCRTTVKFTSTFRMHINSRALLLSISGE